jgi:hypothetical protein
MVRSYIEKVLWLCVKAFVFGIIEWEHCAHLWATFDFAFSGCSCSGESWILVSASFGLVYFVPKSP